MIAPATLPHYNKNRYEPEETTTSIRAAGATLHPGTPADIKQAEAAGGGIRRAGLGLPASYSGQAARGAGDRVTYCSP